MKPKEWKAASADEAWKVMICALDADRAERAAETIAAIIGDPAKPPLDVIRQFSGADIADALQAFIDKSAESVRLGLKGGKP